MLNIALLVLILANNGTVQITLTDFDSLEDCETSRVAVSKILTKANYNVLSAMCGKTSLRLTPFEHGASSEDRIYRYRVVISGKDSFEITSLDAEQTCTAAPSANPAVYCGWSSQSVVRK